MNFPFPEALELIDQSILDGALGGTSAGGDKDSVFPELWDWLKAEFSLTSMFDVGCGCGWTMKYFAGLGCQVYGIDGSEKVLERHQLPRCVERHDLRDGVWLPPVKSDLVWCCEVAEHVPAEYVDNVIDTIALHAAKVIAFCAAPPGCGGHNHVNCQPTEYWAERFLAREWVLSPTLTDKARGLCQQNAWRSERNYFKRSGIILVPKQECVV